MTGTGPPAERDERVGHGAEPAGYRHDPHRFHGLSVPDPRFAADDGAADAGLASVLAAYAERTVTARALVSALVDARVMVPLVAVLDSAHDSAPDPAADPAPDGHAQEKDSHMATVSMVGPDGRRALLAFTSVSAMAAWDPAARGIPHDASTVARAAVEEGAAALLLDLAGPRRTLVTGAGLLALAERGAWSPAYADPLLGSVVARLLDGLPGLERWALGPGPDGADLLVSVRPGVGADADDVGHRVAEVLGRDPVVADRCPEGFAVGLLGDG